MSSKKPSKEIQRLVGVGVLALSAAACSTTGDMSGPFSGGNTNPNAENPKSIFTLNLGKGKLRSPEGDCHLKYNSKRNKMFMTLSCSSSQRISAQEQFSKALTLCSGGNVFVNPSRILESPHWGKTTLNYHPEIISQDVGVVYMPKNCFNYTAQAQEATELAKPSDKGHEHSHANDKPVIIVPETSTGRTTSGPSSTPCGSGAHNHEHAHEVEEASSSQVIHFGCHRIDLPHTHDITNGNELGVKPHYPPVTPSMSYK